MGALLALAIQVRPYLASAVSGVDSDRCHASNLVITVAYIAMNAHFLSLIWKRHQRTHYGTTKAA